MCKCASAVQNTRAPALGVLHARSHGVCHATLCLLPTNLFDAVFDKFLPFSEFRFGLLRATSPPKAVPGGRYDTAKWIKQSGKKVSAAFFRSALAVLEHRTFASAVRRLGDGYGFRRCRELFAEEQRTGCDRVDCSGCADGNAGPSNGSNRADPDSSEKGEEASANDRHLRE